MTITLQHVNPLGARVFMGTLTGDADIHDSLRQVALANGIQTAVFHLLGGLREVEFRAFDFDSQQRQAPLVFRRPLEIVAGHGTIALLEGQPHIHLHLAVCYPDAAAPAGMVVLAGHAARAAAFAVEFTLTAYEGNPVHRAMHPPTGLMLWQLPPLAPPRAGES